MKFKYLLSITLLSAIIFIVSIVFLMKDKYFFDYKPTADVKVIKQWQLPETLKEVSGIHYLGNQLMACIQDERGVIFIYDLNKNSIVQEIKYSKDGDFEGVTVSGDTAYALRSDGRLYQIKQFLSKQLIVSYDQLFLEEGIDVEGLMVYQSSKLLIGLKTSKRLKDDKEVIVYTYNLKSKKLSEFIRIKPDDPIFNAIPDQHPSKEFFLSEVGYHNNKFYITEGKTPKLMILNKDKQPEHLLYLSEDKFPQPEGISFDENGRIFIANEEGFNQTQSINLIEILPLKN